MRITNDIIYGNMLDSLDRQLSVQNDLMLQLDSGKRVNQPSDDPAATAAFIQNSAETAANTQALHNISTLSGGFQVADSALGSAVSVLTRAVTVGQEGTNPTLSSANRSALADEIGAIQQQLLGIANTTYQGQYIFSGTKNSTPAYVVDGTQPDGVRYQGNTSTNQLQVVLGQNVKANVPGSQIFENSSGNAFQSLYDLQNALTTGTTTQIQAAVQSVNSALNALSSQRTFYGTSINRLSTIQSVINTSNVQLASQDNALVGADLAQTISNLSSTQLQRNAILEASGQINRSSLLDYLR